MDCHAHDRPIVWNVLDLFQGSFIIGSCRRSPLIGGRCWRGRTYFDGAPVFSIACPTGWVFWAPLRKDPSSRPGCLSALGSSLPAVQTESGLFVTVLAGSMAFPFHLFYLDKWLYTCFAFIGSIIAESSCDRYAKESMSLFVFECLGRGEMGHTQCFLVDIAHSYFIKIILTHTSCIIILKDTPACHLLVDCSHSLLSAVHPSWLLFPLSYNYATAVAVDSKICMHIATVWPEQTEWHLLLCRN